MPGDFPAEQQHGHGELEQRAGPDAAQLLKEQLKNTLDVVVVDNGVLHKLAGRHVARQGQGGG